MAQEMDKRCALHGGQSDGTGILISKLHDLHFSLHWAEDDKGGILEARFSLCMIMQRLSLSPYVI